MMIANGRSDGQTDDRLFGNGFHHGRVTVTQIAHRDPAGEIEILYVVGIPDSGPASADERQGRCIGRDKELLLLFQNFLGLGGHGGDSSW